MRKILFIVVTLMLCAFTSWHNNLDEAKQLATQSHKYILLNFSGSDWCGPCIRMHKEIFDSEAFQQYASANLVLVNADFPRLRKNQLAKEQTTQNEALAEQYDHEGKFPYTALLN